MVPRLSAVMSAAPTDIDSPSPEDQVLLGWTASEACEHLRAGDVGACEMLEAVLRQHMRTRFLRTFTAVHFERAREAARRADHCSPEQRSARLLHGLPVSVKDNIDVAGWPTTAGSPALNAHTPARSASVVASLQAQGAVIVGKNNMHEFALGVTSHNARHGAVRNPWDLRRSAGGSSGGTAAAVAARVVPLGLGTDTGGSVRIPAALCGVVGWRPSTGRWSTDGVVPISQTRDTIGPLARSVADCQLVDQIVGDACPTPIGPRPDEIRLGVPEDSFWRGLAPDLEVQARQLLDRLAAQGVTLVPCHYDDGTDDLGWLAGLHIALYENLDGLRDYWVSHGLNFDALRVAAQVASPDVRVVFDKLLLGREQLTAPYRRAMIEQRAATLRAYRRCREEHRLDALVFPTAPLPAGRIGEDEAVEWAGALWPTFPSYTRQSIAATIAGVPAISLPGGLVKGLPWGIELDGFAGADNDLLAVAKVVESCLRPMPICPLLKLPS